jgi:hypothetical protein
VRGIGFVLVIVGLLGLAAARLTQNYVVNELVARRDDREAAGEAWNILTELMRGSFRLMIVVGLLFLLAAWLAGPGRRALATRGWLAPVLSNRVWAYIALAVVGLVFLLSTEVADFARLLVVAVLLALGATWIELTRRQTAVEFPNAEASTFFSDTWSRLSAWWDEQKAARVAPPPPPAGGAASTTDVTARLATLAELHAKGELSDDEYAAAKAQVLSGS